MGRITLIPQLLLIVCAVTVLGKDYKIVCYYSNWSQYRASPYQFFPRHIDPFLCTHIMYAFSRVVDTRLVPYEWNDDSSPWRQGHFQQVMSFKRTNPNLKVLSAVGGWTHGSAPFTKMLETDEKMNAFIQNAIAFLRQRDFDGIDIDWEYPGSREGANPATDKKRFADLLKAMLAAFVEEAQRTGRERLLLTAAVPAGKTTIDVGYDFQAISDNLDFINVMSYDLHGQWDDYLGVNAPLYGRSDETGDQVYLNQDWVMNYYVDNGVPREKLIMGLATFGRSFTLQNSLKTDMGELALRGGTKGRYTREAGYLAYYEICEHLRNPNEFYRWTRAWDAEQVSPYAYWRDQWVGYDDIESTTIKTQYIVANGFGGAMVWELASDDFRNSSCGKGYYPLINTIKNVLQSASDPTRTSQRTTLSTTTPRTTTTTTTQRTTPTTTTQRTTPTTTTQRTTPTTTTPRTTQRTTPSTTPRTTTTTTTQRTTPTTTTQRTTPTTTTQRTTPSSTSTTTTLRTTPRTTPSTRTSTQKATQSTTAKRTTPRTTTVKKTPDLPTTRTTLSTTMVKTAPSTTTRKTTPTITTSTKTWITTNKTPIWMRPTTSLPQTTQKSNIKPKKARFNTGYQNFDDLCTAPGLLLPYNPDCSKYVQCVYVNDGRPLWFIMECQEGLHFSASDLWCDYPENVPDCPQPPTSEPQFNFTVTDLLTIPSATSMTTISLSTYQPSMIPDNTLTSEPYSHTNPADSTERFSETSRSVIYNPGRGGPASDSGSTSSNITDSTPSNQTVDSKRFSRINQTSQNFDILCTTSGQLLPLNSDCRKYVQCIYTNTPYATWHIMTCQEGLYYDSIKFWCDFPENITGCPSPPSSYRTVKQSEGAILQAPGRGGIVDIEEKTTYAYETNKPRLGTEGVQVICGPGNLIVQNNADCSTFVACVFWRVHYVMKCPAGLYYNKDGFCDWPYNVPECNY